VVVSALHRGEVRAGPGEKGLVTVVTRGRALGHASE